MSRLGASWLLAVMLWIAGCNGSDSTPTLTRPQALTRPPALSLVPGREKQKRKATREVGSLMRKRVR